MRLLRFVLTVFWMSVQRQLAFRANLVFQLFLTTFGIAAGILAIVPLFSLTSTVRGWNLAGTIVLLGTFQLVSGLLSTLIEPNLSFFQGKVINGEIDDLLIRPMPSLFMVSFNSCNPWALFQVLIGIIVTVTGLSMIGTNYSIIRILIYVVQVFVGFLVAWAYRITLASIAFWAPGTEPSVLFDAFWQFGRYPTTVYSRPVRWVLTFIVPVALIAMYPAQTLIHGAQINVLIGSLLLAVFSMGLSYSIWRLGLRRYTSATT